MTKSELFISLSHKSFIHSAVKLRSIMQFAFVAVMSMMIYNEWQKSPDNTIISLGWLASLIYPIVIILLLLNVKWMRQYLSYFMDYYIVGFVAFSLLATLLSSISLNTALISTIAIVMGFVIITDKRLHLINLAIVFLAATFGLMFCSSQESAVFNFSLISFYTALLSYILANIMNNEIGMMRAKGEQYKLLANNISDVILVHEMTTSTVSFISSSVQQLTGTTADRIKPLYPDGIIEADDIGIWRELVKKVSHFGMFSSEIRMTRDDGTVFWTEWIGKIVKDNDEKPDQINFNIRDISERKQKAREIEKVNQDLFALNEKLEASNEELEQFAFITSHDLKEPLRTISSYIQILEKKYHNKLDDEDHVYLDFIIGAAKRMSNMIDDILSFSRIGGMDLKRESYALTEAVKEAIQVLHQQIDQSSAQIIIGTECKVNGDPLMLSLLFQNLIGNGIKYNISEPPIIRISCEDSEDTHTVTVADNGIGINEDFKEEIFAPFRRLHGVGKYEGTGIGLAICRKIVQLHGGKLWVEDSANGGSMFIFTLPKSKD